MICSGLPTQFILRQGRGLLDLASPSRLRLSSNQLGLGSSSSVTILAHVTKTWEDHDVRDLTLDLWIQERLRVKTSWHFGHYVLEVSTRKHLTCGRVQQADRPCARGESAKPFTPPLASTNARLHLYNNMTQASRRICIGKGAGQPPASVAGPKDGATLRLR